MIQAQSGQTIGAQMVNASTGAAFTGTVTVYVTLDAGTQALGSVSAGVCTLEGNGYYTYRPAAAETDAELVAFTFIGSGAIPQTIQVEPVSPSQAAAIGAATGTLAITGRQLIIDALQEIGVVGAVDEASPEDVERGVRTLANILDGWNATRGTVAAEMFASYTATASLQPQTIGPSGATWTASQRPVSVEGVDLVVDDLIYPLRPLSAEDWAALGNPTFASSSPSACYYAPAWPLGAFYFYPVLAAAVTIRVRTRTVLGAIALTDTVSYPPGYQDALMLTLAERLVSPMRVPMPQTLPRTAALARARAFGNNTPVPMLVTAGFTPASQGRSTFDPLTRQMH